MQEAYGKSTTSLVCTEDCQDWNCSTLKVNNMYDVGYYSNHSTWYMDIFVFTILQDYRLLIPGAGQPGAARSSRLLQMVYVRCVLRLMDTGSYTENTVRTGSCHILIQKYFCSISSAYLMSLWRGKIFQENSTLPLGARICPPGLAVSP